MQRTRPRPDLVTRTTAVLTAVVGVCLTAPIHAAELSRAVEPVPASADSFITVDFEAWLAELLRELDAIDDVNHAGSVSRSRRPAARCAVGPHRSLDALARADRSAHGLRLLMESVETPTLEAEADATRRYAALHEITWPMAIADWSIFGPTFGVREYPTTAVIDHRGVVRALGHDPRRPDETTALVAELLEERRTDLGDETARAVPPAITPRDPDAPWSLPAGWRVSSERPPMRFATFVIDDADGPVEVAITRFPGDVGGELANVNRWRGGVGLPPVTEEQLPSHLNRFENPGFAGDALRLRGERGSMIVAGIKEHAADRTWFVRVMGSEPVLNRVVAKVDEFIRSFGGVK